MLEIIRRHPFGFFLAVLMHLGIVAIMIFGLDWINPPQVQKPRGQIVQARLIDTKQLQKEQQDKNRRLDVQKAKKAEQLRKKKAEEKRRKQLKIKQQQEKKKRQELQRKKAEAEKKRQLALKKKQQEKKKKLALEKKKKLEQQKRKELEARKKAEQKKKADARKKAEQERKRKEKAAAKKKAEQERKRKAAAEKKRKAAELAAQKSREAELAAQWAAEKDQRERASVSAAIKRKVQRNWLRPPAASDRNLQATVRVRLNSRGSVLLVQVLKSSGNAAFDRSVVTAVNKADPLPMPKSKTLISEFREFTFIFRPTP